ncbi:glycosyltransferase family 4 protein [Candidatus Berkelbacteria bacterium]|nr:glycosyltransferase family 4 protein [Candidatus Berkelbacteria bacterium]
MTLHIGLDGSRIAKAQYTGTEHYSFEIFTHLFRVAPHHHYTIYAPRMSTKQLATGSADVTWKIIPFPRLWTQIRLSLELVGGSTPDVLFIPSHTLPLIHPIPTVATVHDLGFKHFPRYYGRVERLYQEFGLWRATAGATRLIAISEATKKDVLRFTHYPARQIDVVHHGVDLERFHAAAPNEHPGPEQRSHLPYLYGVGRIEAKKNTPRLLRAFRILKEKHKIPHQLILAGKPGQHGYDEVEAVLSELPDETRRSIHLIGYVDDDANARWLRFADALVFPSGFEGFGMPALEAMASGTPVVASNTSSLPEIIGDTGILVNHTRAEAIAEGVLKLIRKPTTRKRLVAAGLERARMFTWERAARQTIAVLERAAAKDNHAE